MKTLYQLALLAAVMLPATAQAQLTVDRTKYPDYSDKINVDTELLRSIGTRSKGMRRAPAAPRPDHVNNALTKHFPPVFNQAGGSCGSASRIGYMFTHEINAYRNLDASLPINQYPTHFVWLLTSGNSGKDQFVTSIGVPSAQTYGGITYSSLFGYQEERYSDFGWMTGYDKWFEAMHNRMLRPTHLPLSVETEAGRELLKNWLWNHNGDTDFAAGGIVGIGVASGGTWKDIPKTPANDAAGVSGKGYVQDWGRSVDHALTIVGYDDRIEFDLDKNGKIGETDKDEVGAWIVVNSWGDGWENGGFIYCPYARATPVITTNGKVTGGWWQPELYRVRKNYRPLRTIKLQMDYSRRSEILLKVGISSNLNATKPDFEIDLEHFKFAGDGRNGDSIPAPAVPMLGRWADGQLHQEAMEFGYDLTDLSAGYDRSKPLKYFFTVNARTKSGNGNRAQGSGHIYHAGIIDYEFDRGGIETAFDLGATKVQDVPGGKITTISTIVYGEQYGEVRNLSIDNGRLVWNAPQAGGHNVSAYRIYRNGEQIAETTDTHYTISQNGAYGVAAVYETGVVSKILSLPTPVQRQAPNVAINLKHNGFKIPEIFTRKYDNATIEFWIKPNSLENWNQTIGPGWGEFMAHSDKSGTYTVGWDTSSRTTSLAGSLKTDKWTHIAMVIAKSNLRLHINGGAATSASGNNRHSGIGGFGDLVFSASDEQNSYNDATYDEIRIWDNARAVALLKNSKDVEFSGNILPTGLIAYYKGDIIQIDGRPYLRDCVGGFHAPLINTDAASFEQVNSDKEFATTPNGTLNNINCKINGEAETIVGQATEYTALYPDLAASLVWSAPEAGINNFRGKSVSLVYPAAGNYNLTLTATNATGDKTITITKTISVKAAEVPNAAFTSSLAEVPAGQRVSFTPTQPKPGYTYDWQMPSGVIASSKAITAATAYENKGEYTVTLTVTAPDGQRAVSSQKIKVVEVAPLADFSVSKDILQKNEAFSLLDASKYNPKQWNWLIKGGAKTYTVTGKSCNISIETPGAYDVTLTVRNDKGTDAKTISRAFSVVNADSKNGLSFGTAASVKMQQSPIATNTRELTIEWWMNPGKLADYCCGMGDSDASFHFKVNAKGGINVARKNAQINIARDVVKAGEWHHYALVFKNNLLYIYRDGVQLHRSTFSNNLFPEVSQFMLGTPAAGMTAQLDEFRIWGKALTEEKLHLYANEPIADVAAAEQGDDKLLLYYDFNQNGGAVQDRTSTANHGNRIGFGPDGDAWPLSKGVFNLSFTKEEDVTRTYLSNYKKPFAYNSSRQVNNQQSGRWYQLKDWVLENTVASADGKIISGAHFDRQKNSCFTFTSGYDGFSPLTDHKSFQIVTLPAGVYTLTTTFDEGFADSNASNCYLAVARGTTLPATDDLPAEAIAYARMTQVSRNAINTLTFVLTEPTEVALGLVINMNGQNIASIKEFKLTRAEVSVLNAIEHIDAAPTVGSDQLYDLSGRRVVAPQNGELYIRNGKRIFAK